MGFGRQKQKIMKSNDKGHTFLKWLNLTTGRISLRKIPQNVLRKDAPTTKKKKFQQTIVFYSSSRKQQFRVLWWNSFSPQLCVRVYVDQKVNVDSRPLLQRLCTVQANRGKSFLSFPKTFFYIQRHVLLSLSFTSSSFLPYLSLFLAREPCPLAEMRVRPKNKMKKKKNKRYFMRVGGFLKKERRKTTEGQNSTNIRPS
jgi:hypothetical protein